MPKRTIMDLKAEVEWVTFKNINDKFNFLKDTSKRFEAILDNSKFFDMLRNESKCTESADDGASGSSSSSEEEIILHHSADAMEHHLCKMIMSLNLFAEEMDKVKAIMIEKHNKSPDFEKVPEPVKMKTCEELQNDLFRLVREVTSTDGIDDDDEWQDIDDDDDEDSDNGPSMVCDLQNVVYGFHRLFTSFTELDMSKQMRLNEEQYAQAAKMLIKCLPSKEMKERYGKMAQTYEDYTLALFEDLESRRESNPEEELICEDDDEYEIQRKRRQADRERKMLDFISSLKYLKGEFDDDENMAHMVDVQMQDARMLYAEIQETKRKEG